MNEPCTVVIFGATGNLAKLKLIPALFQLEVAGCLHEKLRIIAFARREYSEDAWLDYIAQVLEKHDIDGEKREVFLRFRERLSC